MADEERASQTEQDRPEVEKDFWTLCVKGTADEIKEMAAAEKLDVTQPLRDGITPLYLAAQNNSLEAVQYFIDAGADVNARTTGEYGDTILHAAIWTKDLRILQTLLEHGADPMLTNGKGWTPLRLARYHVRGKETLQLLIRYMKLEPAENGRSYEGTIEYIDLWSKRCYQLCGDVLIEHSMDRLNTSNIVLGETDRIVYGASQKRRGVVTNIVAADCM